jgi:polyisoprenoid-binding protein YceI
MGVSTFRGTLDDVTASLVAAEDGVRLEGAAKAESISIRTPEQFRAHVLSAEFFDVANHPDVTFHSTNVEVAEDGTATAEGELTIKGITRPIVATGTYTAPSTDAFGNTRGHLTLVTTINRREFDFNWDAPRPNGGSALADDIVITVDMSLVAQA